MANTDTGAPPHPSLLLLVLTSTIGPVALNIFMPSMPGMQAYFEVDYATVQLTLTFYLLAMAISQVAIGPLSDRFGRRPLLIAGLLIYLLGSMLAVFATSITMLILARMVQGIGGASGIVLSRAIIRDCYSREQSASMIGYVTMGMVVGPLVSPYIGGLLDERFGWQASFVLLFGLGAIILALVLAFLPETHINRARGGGFSPLVAGARLLFASPAFWSYTGAISFASGAFFAFLAAAPYIAIELMELPPRVYGQYFPLGAIGYMTGNFLSGRYSIRVGTDRMIFIGSLVGIGATMLLIASTILQIQHPLSLFLPMCIVALSNGLVMPNATARVVSLHPEHAGAASGLAGSIQLLSGALITVLVGEIGDGTQLPMAIVMSIALWMSFLSARMGRRVVRESEG
ncbi:MAG: multidrug effflux MFS transporter [Rhodobiaceae bacterium]|nr:multidrug effflux MFS transporter [Rhodobiaceae bacterium]